MDSIQNKLLFIRKLISLMMIIMTVAVLYFPAPEDDGWQFNEAVRGDHDFFFIN